ncbi:DNA polymerase III subunit gamma/tau [Pseudoramibacter porci]|uniref:DNA-directed DNA polymerase n=1 Tax=Pseudoramibacter porci TaxID=2606631 RepID=A0A7X2NEW4_9FIRM|nr:DNA polymerase III subunit gamma/tau [Pseudoramibacter porci]MSS19351.1 DNA polymerase III subunit gamma/tau [Pseudoramibacter porci]
MAYMALYRKYRPQSFDAVVGQEVTIRILKNQITSGRIGHAYLLTGIRGTGKTTIAKIFARAINCPNNQDGNPCNTCEICREIEQPGVMDIIEIDAASNRGVDEIRDIREKVKYPPTLGRYKVYIIDEVHMLTREAFNALLKTLEEPPAHVVFILATTEPNKLPMTILSRCQRFDIRPISQEAIVARMGEILADLDVQIEPEALQFIAARGDHSMRDALSILDQVIDLQEDGQPITYSQVLDFLGMADQQTIRQLITHIAQRDASSALTLLKTLKERGRDAALILDQMIDAVHQALIVQTTGESAMAILGIGQGDFESLQSAAQLAGSGRLFEIMDVLIDAKEKLKYNDMAEIVLEMTVLKLCSEGAAPAMEAPQVRNSAPKTQRPAQSAPRPQPELARSAAQPPARSAAPISDTRDGQADAVQKAQAAVQRENTATAPKGAGVDVQALKKKMTAVLKKKAPLDGKMFEKGRLIQKDAAHYDLCFFEDSGDQMACDRCTRSQAKLEKLASDIVGRKIQLKIKSVKKNFSDMTLAEKTAAIVGNVPVVRK